jgi:ArsR family transcriptional regulator, virulence genes transcriptional regulator
MPHKSIGFPMSVTAVDNQEDFAKRSAELLSAMANAKRISILAILQTGEQSVGSLSEMVGLTQSALSQHLAKLRHARLVSTRRDAQTVFYSSTSAPVRKVLDVLNDIVGASVTASQAA